MTMNSPNAARRGQERKSTAIRLLCATTLVLSLSIACSARAEDLLKTFQNAINYMQDERGCLSIPYPDRQDACQRAQKEVNKFCKESGPWSCENVDPKMTQKEIEKIKEERDILKAEKENLERNKPSLTDDKNKRDNEDNLKQAENRLNQLNKEREDLESNVSDATKMISDRLYIAKACRDARPEVQKVFESAQSRVKDEHDPEIAELAKRLADSWEKGTQKHEEEMRNSRNAVENCDRILYELGHLPSF